MPKYLTRISLVGVLVVAASCLLWGATATYTWDTTDWNTPWGYVEISNNCATTGEWVYSATGGNPDHMRQATCVGRSDTLDAHIDCTGTWEDLGVTPGNVVSTVQMTDADTYATVWSDCDSIEMGDFELRDSGDSLVATLWAGRDPTSADGDWVAEGSQSAQGVGGLTASNSSIELWLHTNLNTGNAAAGTCTWKIDNLDISIVHAPPATSSISEMLVTSVRFKDGLARWTSTTKGAD
jgi:hypothetical protein